MSEGGSHNQQPLRVAGLFLASVAPQTYIMPPVPATVAAACTAAAVVAYYLYLSNKESDTADLPERQDQAQQQAPETSSAETSSNTAQVKGTAQAKDTAQVKDKSETTRRILAEAQPQVDAPAISPEQQQLIAQQMQRQQSVQQAKVEQRRQQQEAAATAAAAEEAEASAGTPFVDAVVNRAVLAQPADLMAAAKPAGEKKGSGALQNNGKKQSKKKLLSSWAESFTAAVQALEGNTSESSAQARALLDAALASAAKPGAPASALPITLRGIGFLHAATSSLDLAAAAYARALAEAKRKASDSPVVLGCWRDMAILRRERGEHAEAEVCWGEAVAAMQAAQAAAAKSTKGGLSNATVLNNTAACVDLQLARADCLRDQRRYAESEDLIVKALSWRERSLGPNEPTTLAAAYDLSCCRRTASIAAAAAAGASADDAGGQDAATGTATAQTNASDAPPSGCDTEPAASRTARLAAIDAQHMIASDLDSRWQSGLRTLVAKEASSRFAEHVTMLASVAQLHKNHAEAVFLFRVVVDEYSHVQEGGKGEGEGEADAAQMPDESVGLGPVERAELFNSLGESLLEVRHYAAAAPIFKRAKETLEKADGVEDSSIASIEANEARMLSEIGQLDAAAALFDKAKAATTTATESALQSSIPDHSHLMMVNMLHARVLQLYSSQ